MTVRTQIVVLLLLLSCARAADKPKLPDQVFAAKTIAVIAHVGRVPAASDLKRESKLKAEAEKELRKERYFDVVSDPDQADLVLLVLGGGESVWKELFSPSILLPPGIPPRLWDTSEVIGVVVSGGQQPRWSAVPLWVSEEGTARSVSHNFHDYLRKRGKPRPGAQARTEVPESQPAEERQSPHRNADVPPEILSAKTVSFLYFLRDWPEGSPDAPRVGPGGFSVAESLERWGRFALIENPEKADLVFAVYRDWWDDVDDLGRQALLIFRGGQRPDWASMPQWMENSDDRELWRESHLVQLLRKDIEATERGSKLSIAPEQSTSPPSAAPISVASTGDQPKVFVFVQRSDRHAKYSTPEVFHDVLNDLLDYLKTKNVAIAVDEVGGRNHAHAATPLDTIFTIARGARASSVMYVVVDRPLTQWLKITVQCFEMNHKQLWQEEALSGAGGLTNRHGFEVATNKLHTQLDKRVGQDGLPIVPIAKEPVAEKQ
ncbi:MAG: hypothetical protein LAO22_24225 [Acidobacteriia bacterium]|nr:hypothetical protein [Terriglobia bacterium]